MKTTQTGETVLVNGQPVKPADLEKFKEIWFCDFEFRAPDGERPEIRCMCVREFFSGYTREYWWDELVHMEHAPFSIGKDSLFVAFFASAELNCFKQLDWEFPKNILDLYVEHRCVTNNRTVLGGRGLLATLAFYDLVPMGTAEKEEMRQLAMRPGSSYDYTPWERKDLMAYCQEDVNVLADLLHSMRRYIDLPRALLRGRYMAAVARMEDAGTPIDVESLGELRENWDFLKDELVHIIDKDYGVFDKDGTFKLTLFADWLKANGYAWPRLFPTEKLALDDKTFRTMSRQYPKVAALRELRHALGAMRLFRDLAVGGDGRNRCLLSPFASRTGRNQPSNARFIFGASAWIRGLIRPEPERFIAYVDWSQQEFGIAAWLSGDENMKKAYLDSDPYLAFAKMANAVPEDGTKESHPEERKSFKICALAVLFGQSAWGMSRALDCQEAETKRLIRLHQEVFPVFWEWSQAAINHALLLNWTSTVYGWVMHTQQFFKEATGEPNQNYRSLSNLPVQGNGAEMMRLAAIFITERFEALKARGVWAECHCPVHDAFLVGGDVEHEALIVQTTKQAMADASAAVLYGHRLKTDVEVTRHPDRYMDEQRGGKMWRAVWDLIRRHQRGEGSRIAPQELLRALSEDPDSFPLEAGSSCQAHRRDVIHYQRAFPRETQGWTPDHVDLTPWGRHPRPPQSGYFGAMELIREAADGDVIRISNDIADEEFTMPKQGTGRPCGGEMGRMEECIYFGENCPKWCEVQSGRQKDHGSAHVKHIDHDEYIRNKQTRKYVDDKPHGDTTPEAELYQPDTPKDEY